MQDLQLQKAILIDKHGNSLYSHYSSNEGSPLETIITVMKTCMMYYQMNVR